MPRFSSCMCFLLAVRVLKAYKNGTLCPVWLWEDVTNNFQGVVVEGQNYGRCPYLPPLGVARMHMIHILLLDIVH